ncbi:CHRD domain-containing protein [Rhodohalobacter sp.]|uniref:CHRD domain-containing protein n=1 Tax=Rhodohalobacter sp. TaxID=1974210 RepID=UPI002ACEAB33|nr:CHRD domain-containing protein [Rhodohalobacter sp.]MDZ7756175.1 CHRD domain-containing protein [Rhodohalobacter sp.]
MKLITKLPYLVFGFCMMLFGFSFQAHAQTTLEAQLSGSNEVPAITSMASGMVTATLDGNELTVRRFFRRTASSPIATNIAGGAHLHAGMAGENGGVIFPLSITADGETAGMFEASNNTFTLSDGQVDTLMMRGVYVNIHSENYTGGELRGQLLPESDAYYRSNLSGAFEIPSAKTMASGSWCMNFGEILFSYPVLFLD